MMLPLPHLVPLALIAICGLAMAFVPTPAPLTVSEQAELAIAYMKNADPRSEEMFNTVLARDPRNVRVNFALGLRATAQKRYADAEKHLTIASEGEPTNSEIAMSIAVLFQKTRRLDKAHDVYMALHKGNPKDSRYLYNLGTLEISRGNYPAAREHLRNFIALIPKRGAVYRRAKKKIDALTDEIGDGPKPSPTPRVTPAPKKQP